MDIVTIWAGVATIGCGALTYAYLMTKIDLDEVRADFKAENGLNQVFEARINTLRSDNLALEKSVTELSEAHDRLVDERDALVRELGRVKAEKLAMKPKRGPNGKFVSKKPKPAKPIACG